MFKPATQRFNPDNNYEHNPSHDQYQTHSFTTRDDFRGFHNNGQQGHRNELDNGSRNFQNNFTAFHSRSSDMATTLSPLRRHQPESATMIRNQDALQQQHVELQSKSRYPSYALESIRLSTYINFPREITQTPKDMAQAGFFYSGNDDVVYCFCCGQGLRAWEPEDDVWIEHARWSPNCEYVLKCKGSDFVRMVQLAETNPEMAYPSNENSANRIPQLPEQTPMVNGHAAAEGSCYRRDESKTLEGSNSKLLNTVAAQSVITNGYDRDSVIKAINVYKLKEGRSDFSAMNLLEIILDIEDGLINYDELMLTADLNKLKVSDPESKHVIEQPLKNHQSLNAPEVHQQQEAKALLAENRELKDHTTCKVCLEETVSIVFLPCGHLCCCSQCAPALRICPICRGFIKGTVRTYLP